MEEQRSVRKAPEAPVPARKKTVSDEKKKAPGRVGKPAAGTPAGKARAQTAAVKKPAAGAVKKPVAGAVKKARPAAPTENARTHSTVKKAEAAPTARRTQTGKPARPATATAKKPVVPKRAAHGGKPVAAGKKRSAAARAAAKRARKQRQIAMIACALVCVLSLGGALAIHLSGRNDATRGDRANAPEAVVAAQPLTGGTESIQLAHANKPAETRAARANTGDDLTGETPAAETAEPTAAVETGAPDPTEEPEAMATVPIPEVRKMWQMGDIIESARTTNKAYKYQQKIVANGRSVNAYTREVPVAMGDSGEYAQVEGVLTFRGNNYRDSGAYGTIPDDASGLRIAWTKTIGGIDKWTGVGWTGQASIVRWPEETRRIMNITAAKKEKDGLKEVIYGTLDGHIYFLDLDDGEATREAIKVPSSIKGSVSVDPRGLPLLYCGQGIPEVGGKSVKIGTRVFSLIDQSVLLFLDGRDDFCLRRWYAFDCAPLIDAASDTMLQLGENGIFYSVTLNTDYDPEAGTISIDPVVDRQIYKSAVSTRPGMENSLSVYDHYAYYTDNSGLLTCLDINTLEAVWLGDVGDDSDASIVIEEDEEGVWLYQSCELDLNGLSGKVYCRKFNALTGQEIWKVPVDCYRASDSVDAGGFATAAVGKGELGNIVYYNICRVREGGGTLLALDKRTGEIIWTRGTGGYSWSSPVCLYDSNGRGYFVLGNAKGILRLCDGLTGQDIASVDLGANIEGSPAVFDDMLVIGTRGGKIYGVQITGKEI